MERLKTSRLELVASDIQLLEAELESHQKLASMLNAQITNGWPPGEYDTFAIRYFRDCLYSNPEVIGWYGWYALLRSAEDGQYILVGAGGFFGPPDEGGVLEIGYSVVPMYERCGIATEMVGALVRYAFMNNRVKRIIAHTTPDNVSSVRVLEKTGFTFTGPGQDPGTVEYGQESPFT